MNYKTQDKWRKELMDNMFLTMSLSGTVVFLLYLLLYFVSMRYFHVKWRYYILKMSFFFFLFPLGYFKYRIVNTVYEVFSINLPYEITEDKFNDIIIVFKDGLYVSKNIWIVWVFLTISAVFAITLIVVQLTRYYKMKRLFKFIGKDLKHELSEQGKEHVKEIKGELNLKKDIKFFILNSIDVPGVIGVFKPTIYIPYCFVNNNQMSELKLKFVLKHELIHIKQRDLLFKFIALLVIATNWYNPFAYLIFYEVCNMCEICCDEEVLRGEEKGYTKLYSELLIDIVSESKTFLNNNKFMYGLLNNDKKVIRRRILEMKRGKKKYLTVVSTLVGVFVFLLGTSTALAYEPASKVVAQEKELITVEPSTTGEFISEGEVMLKKIPYDEFFTSEEGEVFQVTQKQMRTDDSEQRISCGHQFVSGIYNMHTPSGRGCKMVTYSAKRCSICGQVNLGNLISTTTYPSCPH